MLKHFLILLSLFSSFVFSQKSEQKNDSIKPKIGLVLSGGAAKGFAHIGVLKAIEEAGLELDYIAGTSMGAAVAALYATGYSAKQIDSIIMSIDFTKMLTDDIDRKYNSFFDKKNNEKYILKLPIKNFKIGLPIALSKGQSTYNKLSELYHPVDHITDFSKLPIPFFCIATNIETGKQVEINSGSLALAVRSSASLPTLLAPSVIDSVTVIDGGISNNFPIKEMRDKGIDYVIGIDVQGSLKKQRNLDSAVKVIDQIVNFQLYGKDSTSLKQDVDLYLHPDVREFSIIDFDKKRQIIDAGYEKAKSYIPQLKKLAQEQPLQKEKKKLILDTKKYIVNSYEITGAKNYTRRYIRGKLNFKKGQKISLQEFNKNINYATTTNNFSSIFYSFLEKDSVVDLKIQLTQNPEYKFLKLGAHYDPLYKLAGLVNYTHKHLFIQNDMLSVDLAYGDNVRYGVNYFIDNGNFLSYGLYSRFNQFETVVNSNNITNRYGFDFSDVNQINFEYEDFTNYIYTQANYLNKYAISIGMEHKHIRSFTNNFSSTEDDVRAFFDDSHYLTILGKLEADTYDKKSFPNKGVLVNATWRSFLTSTDFGKNFTPFSQVRLTMEGIWTLSNRLSFFGQGDGALSFTEGTLPNFNYALGGYGKSFINNFIPFYGYKFSELEGNSFLKTLGTLRYRYYKKNYVNFTTNYAIVSNNILDLMRTESFFKNAKTGYAIGLGSDTILGPFEINYAWSPENRYKTVYISAGFWF